VPSSYTTSLGVAPIRTSRQVEHAWHTQQRARLAVVPRTYVFVDPTYGIEHAPVTYPPSILLPNHIARSAMTRARDR